MAGLRAWAIYRPHRSGETLWEEEEVITSPSCHDAPLHPALPLDVALAGADPHVACEGDSVYKAPGMRGCLCTRVGSWARLRNHGAEHRMAPSELLCETRGPPGSLPRMLQDRLPINCWSLPNKVDIKLKQETKVASSSVFHFC